MREFPPLSNFPHLHLLWWENSGRGNFPPCLISPHLHLLWCSALMRELRKGKFPPFSNFPPFTLMPHQHPFHHTHCLFHQYFHVSHFLMLTCFCRHSQLPPFTPTVSYSLHHLLLLLLLLLLHLLLWRTPSITFSAFIIKSHFLALFSNSSIYSFHHLLHLHHQKPSSSHPPWLGILILELTFCRHAFVNEWTQEKEMSSIFH